MNGELAGKIDRGKQHITDFPGQVRIRFRQLPQFLLKLAKHGFDIRPIKTQPCGPFLELFGTQKGRQCRWHIVEGAGVWPVAGRCLASAFAFLVGLPVARCRIIGPTVRIPEHMRMPGKHLGCDCAGNVIEIEGVEFLGHARVEHHLEQQIAEFVADRVEISRPDGVIDLDGRLIGLPDERSFPGVDRAAHGLRPVPVSERHGMIFVQASPGDAFDVDSLLQGMAEEFSPYGFGTWPMYASRRFTFRMNWKIAVDTFLEPYHFPFLHQNTVGPIFISNLCLYDGFGPHLREVLPRNTVREMREMPPNDWDLVDRSALVYLLFPNAAFIVQRDHLEVWRCFPKADDPGGCTVLFEFYVPEEVTGEKARIHWDKNVDLAVRTVIEEDFPTGESIQAGFAAGANEHLTFGRNEPALAHFETMVNRYVAEAA